MYAQRNELCGKLKAKLSDKRGNKLKLNKHGKSKKIEQFLEHRKVTENQKKGLNLKGSRRVVRVE